MTRYKFFINLFLWILCSVFFVLLIFLFNEVPDNKYAFKYNKKDLPSYKNDTNNMDLNSISRIAHLFGYTEAKTIIKEQPAATVNTDYKFIGTVKDSDGIEYYYFKNKNNNKILKASTVKTDKYNFISKIDDRYFYIISKNENIIIQRTK